MTGEVAFKKAIGCAKTPGFFKKAGGLRDVPDRVPLSCPLVSSMLRFAGAFTDGSTAIGSGRMTIGHKFGLSVHATRSRR